MKKFVNLLLIFIIFSACTLAPGYKRPEAPVPLVKASENSNSDKKKITGITWEEFFKSPDLQRVIKIALENNRDLKIANLNVAAARQIHNVARSNLLPSVAAVGSNTRQKSSINPTASKKIYSANLAVTAYELDFFGRLQSLKKSALEEFLATQEARNITKISLITETVDAYAQLVLDSEILEIAKDTMLAQSERYNFSKMRYDNGIDSQTDVLNAGDVMENANAVYQTYEKLVVEDKNALMTLMGIFDEKLLPQNIKINDIEINENLLDSIPSESLLARPDIKAAEHILKSANANIGAARAAFFPSITLTGSAGYQSKDLGSLFNSSVWSFTPQINLPIFTAGRNIANLKLANLRKEIEIASYEKTIQTAFSEASNELAARKSVTNRLKSFDEILKMREKTYNISKLKYQEGLASKANLVDGKIYFLTAKQNQAILKKEYLTNLINLYKVLGGGADIEN